NWKLFKKPCRKREETIKFITSPSQPPQRGGVKSSPPLEGLGEDSTAPCTAKATKPMTNRAIARFAEWTWWRPPNSPPSEGPGEDTLAPCIQKLFRKNREVAPFAEWI